MEQFNAFLVLLDSNLSGSWWFPALLIGTGIFFTIYLGFPQFKYFNSALKIVSGKTKNSESNGETTGFQAHLQQLCLALWVQVILVVLL